MNSITTRRLVIRELEPNDWTDVYQMNTSREVMRQIANGQIKTDEEEKVGFTRLIDAYKKKDGLGVWAVVTKAEDIFIGAASMTLLKGTDEIQLGYRFKKEYWGQGYATEVAKELVGYGFRQLGLKKVVATTNLTNTASIRVLEKAGLSFIRTGYFYDWEMNYFEILAQEYHASS